MEAVHSSVRTQVGRIHVGPYENRVSQSPLQALLKITRRIERHRTYQSQQGHVILSSRICTQETKSITRFDFLLLQDRHALHGILHPILCAGFVFDSSHSSDPDQIIDNIFNRVRHFGPRVYAEGHGFLPLDIELIRVHEELYVLNEVHFSNSNETGNHGMVPARSSSIKKLLKRGRVEGDEDCDGDRKAKRKRVSKGESCVICLEEMAVGSYAADLPCQHTFHHSCIVEWLKTSHYCPLCRFELPTELD